MAPNPASSQINVAFNIAEVIRQRNTLQVFNASGQMVIQKAIELKKGENQFELDLHQLNNGFYTIILSNGHQIARSRFVKQ